MIFIAIFTFVPMHQCDLKAVPPRFLWIEHNAKFRVWSPKCLTHAFSIPPIHSSAFTVKMQRKSRWTYIPVLVAVFAFQEKALAYQCSMTTLCPVSSSSFSTSSSFSFFSSTVAASASTALRFRPRPARYHSITAFYLCMNYFPKGMHAVFA